MPDNMDKEQDSSLSMMDLKGAVRVELNTQIES